MNHEMRVRIYNGGSYVPGVLEVVCSCGWFTCLESREVDVREIVQTEEAHLREVDGRTP